MRAILTLDPNHNMKLWMEVSVLAPSMDELGTVGVGGGGVLRGGAGGSCWGSMGGIRVFVGT